MSIPADKGHITDAGLSDEKSVVVDTLRHDALNQTSGTGARQTLSRKETLSAYFTIAAAAFGLIRYVVSAILQYARMLM